MKKRPDENEYQYIWRLGQAKDSGVLEMNWPELAEVLNGELHIDDPRQEAAYRKPFQSASLYYENVFAKMKSDDDYAKQMQSQKDELYMLKKQYQDQRREYNKLLDGDARWRHLESMMVESAQALNLSRPLVIAKTNVTTGEHEAILFLNDWHMGLKTKNIFNTYDLEIYRQRVQTVVSKAKEFIRLHNISVLHIVLLGDACHGVIHVGVRVASEEDVCDELMNVSEDFAQVISELANEVSFTKVYSTYGNHLRSIQNKHDSIHADNMEKIIPWWLKQRLANRKDIEIVDGEYFEFVRVNILGHALAASHGDLDTVKNFGSTVNNIFTQVYGEVIEYAVMGDKHHLEEFEQFGIETALCRSLCGVDEYANGHRLYSKPGQTLMIFNRSEGRLCTYNIKV